ncbi:receptor-like cytoplasmic kinase 176 isoform X2 [Rosa chinensis]|uniref:receptor-like cytoplasmic kinase 176 isoform X2 n=1 Tax=Rosa chinensis TaxID=74649 RepID=UPI001AD935D1|nr:receptor-like cytoplasmic kinase 176 isoform X2 [Rosa chinensis]XP_040365067.1 receptor-like cytoplasmic kinase 176 isoform X2 [Rosa chinensis]
MQTRAPIEISLHPKLLIQNKRRARTWIHLTHIGSVGLVVAFLACRYWALLQRVSNRTRIRAESLPHRVPSTPRTEVEILLKSFFFNELKTATSNFRPDNVVGEGGFGTVFKGWLDQNSLAAAKPGTGIAVAVKRLNQERHQGREEWFTEIYYLGQLRHPNLVKLIGYCSEDNELLLVYEFMPRGSLENHIFRRSSHFQPLSWTVRMKIALGAAKALAFLHNEAKVIHRDFKTSNILLDSTYNVKISDFGLAVDARAFDRHRGAKTRVKGTYGYAAPEYIETRVMGTYGYAAPEYVATGRLTTKCDVYGFGAVMLEMISGKRVFDRNRPPGEQNLVEWAKPYLFSKHRVLQIFDHHIKGQFSVARALKAVDLAFLCLSRDPKLRPNMNNVVKILEKLQEYSDMDGLGISQNKRRQIRMSVQSMVPNTAGEVALEPAIQHP